MIFNNQTSRDNIRNTIEALLKNGILPIINENDTTATEEIRFGDNDKLSALVASLLEVDRLILASNTYGLYDDHGETIPSIDDISTVRKYVHESKSSQGTGGMTSKLDATAIAQKNNIETWIINGHEENFLLKSMQDQSKLTVIKGATSDRLKG